MCGCMSLLLLLERCCALWMSQHCALCVDDAVVGAVRDVQGWPEPDIHTVYDRMHGDFPAINTIYTPYIPINVWFWPTLGMLCVLLLLLLERCWAL